MVLRAGDEFAGFVIERVLGAGGMGVVYLAQHPRLESRVALKVLNESLAANPKASAKFDREAELAARLDHPNIVPIYDRSAPGEPWLWLSLPRAGTVPGRFPSSGSVAAVPSSARVTKPPTCITPRP
ncbi:protein kinase domain-containing protein [Nocardia sp. NBC_00416]|uniref:protein kinase domain-containing protein n=1 Tax=Nocardia sp. NBC_00416 TaxID=2975991 RepID=UPI002E1C5D7E